MKKLNHIKTFESWSIFKNLFTCSSCDKSEDESSVTPDSIKSRLSSNRSQIGDKLKQEAEERFPSLVKELDRLLKNTNEYSVEVKQNPTFKTKSTDSVNYILLNKIESHYNDLGFRTTKSYDGRNLCKDDRFVIIVD